jgi:hypothetical protein
MLRGRDLLSTKSHCNVLVEMGARRPPSVVLECESVSARGLSVGPSQPRPLLAVVW